MTKALTFFEIDVPDPRCVSHLAFDITPSELVGGGGAVLVDNNAAGIERSWGATGGVFLDLAPAFGSADLFTDGTGAILTTDITGLALGSGDFCIEFYWWKNTSNAVERNICGQRFGVGGANSTRSFNIEFDSTGHLRGLVFQGNTQITTASTTLFTTTSSVNHHVAFTRLGSLLMLFVDGVLESTAAITGAINTSAGALAFGQDGDDTANRWNGFIDEFTYCKYARRTASFTPEPTNYPDFTPALLPPLRTMRFAIDSGYLPNDIDVIPNLRELKIDPAIISLGQDLGQRATVTATLRDHRHIFDTEPFTSGTFWGKFRAFYGLRLQGFPCRVVNGALGQALGVMETRNFRIETTNGPTPKGEFQIVAKDVLKLADGERAQAPVLSNGFLSANITNVATAATLAPAGIGDVEYPGSGSVAIGGSEICSFTRAGDTLTLIRAQNNTAAVAHNAQDRVQLVLGYFAESPADIIADLLQNYASVPEQLINQTAWNLEIDTYLSTVYTATIAEPTSVETLVSELIEQVGLALWWDDIGQQIKLQVLRPVASTADVYNASNYLADSLEITEQPEKRLTQVYTYFAKINPLVPQDQENNFRSSAFTVDNEAEVVYGTAAIKKIFSRWIPAGGRAVALSLNDVLLARFRDPPRRIAFNVLRGSGITPTLGVGYQIGGWPFQQRDGSAATVPAQITRLNPRADYFEVEVEEISPNIVAVGSPGVHDVIIDSDLFNVNLRNMHDSIYGTPVSGNEVRCTINEDVTVGATATSIAAFDVGSWPGGVIVTVILNGRIQGCGGAGGAGSGTISLPGQQGFGGGPALLTRKAISLTDVNGQIWGGGGGGGGGGSLGNLNGQALAGGSGGGGGAGTFGGAGGPAGGGVNVGNPGNQGSADAGGPGGPAGPNAGGTGPGYAASAGGTGGGPGLTGSTGQNGQAPIHTNGNVGGGSGSAIDGVSFVTTVGGAGDRRGPQVN